MCPRAAFWTKAATKALGAMVYYDRPTKFAPDVEERIMKAVHEVMPKSFLATKAGASSQNPLPSADHIS
jgi:hypothetical protein